MITFFLLKDILQGLPENNHIYYFQYNDLYLEGRSCQKILSLQQILESKIECSFLILNVTPYMFNFFSFLEII